MNRQGMVVSGYGGFYQVRCNGEVIDCKPRGRLKKTYSKIYPGDEAEISLLDDGTGMIEALGPRRTTLRRPNVVNLDQLLITLSWTLPDYDLLLLDRLLVMAELSNIRPLICFTKVDLLLSEQQPQLEAIRQCYEKAGYQVLTTSIYDEAAVAELRRHLRGGLTVLAGPSGVGKSSLLNLLLGEDNAEVGSVSDRLRRGKHTTRYARILPLGDRDQDGFLADTPGFFTLELPDDFILANLPLCYPDFLRQGECRFDGCMHRKEPDCAIKQAVEQGEIDEGRYQRYLRLLEELQNREVRY